MAVFPSRKPAIPEVWKNENHETYLRDASFSSYLEMEERDFIHSLSKSMHSSSPKERKQRCIREADHKLSSNQSATTGPTGNESQIKLKRAVRLKFLTGFQCKGSCYKSINIHQAAAMNTAVPIITSSEREGESFEDAESDTSSDLFEIENLSGLGQDFTTEFSVAEDNAEERAITTSMIPCKQRGSLFGCKSSKAVNVAEAAYKVTKKGKVHSRPTTKDYKFPHAQHAQPIVCSIWHALK